MKGKDFYYKQIEYGPFTWALGDKNMHKSVADYGVYAQQVRSEILKEKYEAFLKIRPHASAVLVELFGEAAFKVFLHLDFSNISESQCLEILSILRPIEDDEDDSRAIRAMFGEIT
jgi:hypothetical protein